VRAREREREREKEIERERVCVCVCERERERESERERERERTRHAWMTSERMLPSSTSPAAAVINRPSASIIKTFVTSPCMYVYVCVNVFVNV
jgi:hypothetical protein